MVGTNIATNKIAKLTTGAITNHLKFLAKEYHPFRPILEDTIPTPNPIAPPTSTATMPPPPNMAAAIPNIAPIEPFKRALPKFPVRSE